MGVAGQRHLSYEEASNWVLCALLNKVKEMKLTRLLLLALLCFTLAPILWQCRQRWRATAGAALGAAAEADRKLSVSRAQDSWSQGRGFETLGELFNLDGGLQSWIVRFCFMICCWVSVFCVWSLNIYCMLNVKSREKLCRVYWVTRKCIVNVWL